MSCLKKENLDEIKDIIQEYFENNRHGNHGNYNIFSIIEINNKNLIKVEYGYRSIECIFTICIYDDNAVTVYHDEIKILDEIILHITEKNKKVITEFASSKLHNLFDKFLSIKNNLFIKSFES